MPSALDQRTTEADQIQRTGSLKRGTDNPKPNDALASDLGGPPVGLVALQ